MSMQDDPTAPRAYQPYRIRYDPETMRYAVFKLRRWGRPKRITPWEDSEHDAWFWAESACVNHAFTPNDWHGVGYCKMMQVATLPPPTPQHPFTHNPWLRSWTNAPRWVYKLYGTPLGWDKLA